MRRGEGRPEPRDQKAGNSSCPTVMTGTPSVSRISSVFGRSRIALAPAATTVTGVSDSSRRSAEMSKLVSAPRCAPPMPPVAKTSIPARCAPIIVAATVVAPVPPVARHAARSARESLATPFACASVSSVGASRPDVEPPVDHGDGRGHGAGGADLVLDPAGGLEVLRPGHPVGDDGRFERHHRAAFFLRGADLVGQDGRDPHASTSPET